MGTWGMGIKENDTSTDVYETFFENYNNGLKPTEIKNIILSQFEFSLNDFEDKYNVLLPLALCLWEVCELDSNLHQQVKSIVDTGDDLKVITGLEATKEDINKRAKILLKFIDKISIPKEKPKARKKPPIQLDSIYKSGSCVSFKYCNNNYGGAIIIESAFYKSNGRMSIVLTDINMSEPPLFENFLNAKMLNFEWEETYGGGDKFFAKINEKGEKVTGRISVSSYEYFNTKSDDRDIYFNNCDEIFNIVGQLPLYIKILLSTSYVKNETITDILNYRFNEFKKISNETIKELNPLLSGIK